MDRATLPYVLVAERSVLPTIRTVLAGLEANGNPASITIVPPTSQVAEFRSNCAATVQVVAEDDVLPDWSLSRVRSMLPNHNNPGWYLQQLLKLSYGFYAGVPEYVVWDADTVMLSPVRFKQDGAVLMNIAREQHRPYLETFRRLFGYAAPLDRSLVSQYMCVDTDIVGEMRKEIARRHGCDWIEAILSVLPGELLHEFSEYETYGNFLASTHPTKLKLERQQWFRHGSELVRDLESTDLEALRDKFAGYAYVAFERHHPSSLAKRAWSYLEWILRLSS